MKTLSEIEQEIRKVQASIKQSTDNCEKLVLESKELNPLLILWAKLYLGEVG